MNDNYSKQTSTKRQSRVHRILPAGTNPTLNVAAVYEIDFIETREGNMEKYIKIYKNTYHIK